MATEVKRLIKVRVEKGARFKRDGYGKKRQLSDSWRKPRGQHNKQREQKKAKGAHPKPGFGSPVSVRGMHPSGFFEVMVTSAKDLEGLDAKTLAVRISGTVGDKKRAVLQEAALAKGFKVLNARTIKARVKKAPVKKSDEKDAGKEKKTEKKPAEKKAPAKKAAAKPKAETAEKKAPAKKAAAKPKAETAEKKAPAKKAAAKPKAESAEAKPKAEKKPVAKKTAKTGVKKNE